MTIFWSNKLKWWNDELSKTEGPQFELFWFEQDFSKKGAYPYCGPPVSASKIAEIF